MRRSKLLCRWLPALVFLAISSVLLLAQDKAPASATPQPSPQQTQPAGQIPSPGNGPAPLPSPQPAGENRPPQAGNRAAGAAPVSTQSPEEPAGKTGGLYVFKTDVEEVALHATVVDDHNRLVTTLNRGDFTVFENGKQQQITSFRHEDIPVALGIVIDNSGSMRDKREAVNQAALNLVKASNPSDEVFVVNFNDEAFLDQDFTSDLGKLQEALERIDARGGTALYDAIVVSAGQLKSAHLEKRVLLVVTDGEDNASLLTLDQAIRQLQEENGPAVYTIGLLDKDSSHHAKRALQVIAEYTGGVAFFPKDLSEVDSISRQIAHDIRNQYAIGYKPSTPRSTVGFRTIRVTARAHGYGKLQVRTRSGYYARQEQAGK
jgi:VWFA-related protein